MKLNACVAGFLIFVLSFDFQLHAEQVGGEQESFETIKAEAEQGDAYGQSMLGYCYYNGKGVKKDFIEAVKWYRKAAEQENAFAQNNLGSCYYNGQGVTKDYAKAAKWYGKAAEQGVATAQLNLGVAYDEGRGVRQDYAEAVKWYRKAAEQGNVDAQSNLGYSFKIGKGVAQDHAETVKWWRKAAEQGNAPAQYNLGVSYGRGEGVTQNFLQAYVWASLAAAKGLNGAADNRDVYAGRLSRMELSEGQRIAAAFVPSKETPSSKSDNSTLPKKPVATGSGFFITDNGYVISNYHVVKDASKVRLVTSAGLIEAKVVKVDAANDLALLKADGPSAPLPITSSRSVKLGGTVATVGFPNTSMQGFAPKFAKGEIASLTGASDDARYFQISVPVQPGNSGGALVDVHGNVVGIVSAKLSATDALDATGALPENVNYAVKSSFLLGFLESVSDVANKLKDPNEKDVAFDDVVKSAQEAAVLLLVY